MSTMDELANQVADLTTATTDLLEEVGDQKDRLTTAADVAEQKSIEASGSATEAAQSVTDAAAEVTKATNQANIAESEAERAKTEADRASAISGLDTVEQAVDTALGEFAGLLSESEARAIQWQNENVNFDASGFVHMGKARKHNEQIYGEPINEGMWTYTGNTVMANRLTTGCRSVDSFVIGTSETDFQVISIAGSVSNILGEHELSQSMFDFQLPPAEDGTRIYDSTGDARGSGKASLDLKTDIDPKYGDVPTGTEDEILREAVGRAFEGQVKNGDFRLGDNGEWEDNQDRGTAVIDTTGVLITDTTNASPTSSAMWVGNVGNTTVINTTYIVEVVVESLTDTDAMRLRLGGYGDPNMRHEILTVGRNILTYTAGLTRTVDDCFHLYLGRGATAKVTSFSVKGLTEEVVTHPVDLVALEYYEEELTGRQEIFECIQSLSTTFGTTSVPTVLSTRKLSYFQQYDGQFSEVAANPDFINDRYRCVVWGDLTEPQKREVVAYMGEKLFVGVSGNIVNGRFRARTIRGLGNGDWSAIDSTLSGGNYALAYSGKAFINAQGNKDVGVGVSSGWASDTYFTPKSGSQNNKETSKGTFSPRTNSNLAYKDRCFMYVVATVPRANKGAYHPDLNPWGCANFGKDITAPHYQYMWYSTLFNVNTIQDCWKYRSVFKDTGSIDVGYSGHPDGIFYDGIEVGGLNGIIDWRLPAIANDSPEEAAKVESKVENGTYRGVEKLIRTVPAVSRNTTNAPTSEYHAVGVVGEDDHLKGLKVTKLIAIDGGVITGSSSSFLEAEVYASDDRYYLRLDGGIARSVTGYYMLETETNLSVSGEFSTQMVMGDPANILLTDALKNGWVGTWCPVIPDGTEKTFPFTRKCLELSPYAHWATDNGAVWTSVAAWDINEVTNSRTFSAFDGIVYVVPFKALAKQTKQSSNKPVYNSKAGLMRVTQLSRHNVERGCVFTESLIGKVLTNDSGSGTHSGDLALTYSFVDGQYGRVLNPSEHLLPKHVPLTLGAPNNNSPAVKVLPYQISNNGQGSIGYQANELTWKNLPTTATDIDGTVGQNIEQGKLYRVDSGKHTGLVIHCSVSASNVIMDSNLLGRDGKFYSISSGGEVTKFEVWGGSGWGDDSTIKVTADGSDTFVDLNGNTNLSVVHELAIPYTWTSNHARAGEQVEGVDL